MKIHKQFVHASGDNLKRIVKNAVVTDKKIFDIINEVSRSCDVCLKYKKPAPSPVVGLTWAADFNETFGMDL